MAEEGGGRGHEDWSQPGQESISDGCEPRQSMGLQLMGKLHDESPIFGDESDRCDQPELIINIDGSHIDLCLAHLSGLVISEHLTYAHRPR